MKESRYLIRAPPTQKMKFTEGNDLEKAIAQMAEFKDWQHADDVISECDKQL